MAGESEKDVVSRLIGRGEDVIGRISDLPGAKQFVEATNSMRERIDELQKRMMGIDVLERRVSELERRLEELAGAKATDEPVGRGTHTPAAERARSAVEGSEQAQPGEPTP